MGILILVGSQIAQISNDFV